MESPSKEVNSFKSSPHKEDPVEVDDEDLRWSRSSHAALAAQLPSHGAFHSDTGLVLSRAISDPARRKSVVQRRKSVAAIRDMSSDVRRKSSTVRQLWRDASTADQWVLNEEDQAHIVESVRSMTASLSVKRKYRDQILTRSQKQLGVIDLWKYQLAMTWLQLKNAVKSWIYQLELWAGHLKVIEGHFGTNTMTYFRFLRWLMFLNLFIAIIMLGITLAPFLALKPSKDPDFVSAVNACQSEYHFLASVFSQNYTDVVKAAREKESNFQKVLDVLQGTGWLGNTEVFYGSYFNRTVSVPIAGERVYNMNLAYIFAVGTVFLLCFVLLVKNSAKGLKEGVLNSSGGTITLYCNKVFGAWDYCISMEKTAVIRHKNILQVLQSELEFQRLQWKKEGRTTKEKAKLYFIRLIVNILVIAILSGSLYLIYVCFTNDNLLKLQQDRKLNEILLLVLQYIPSVTITVLNVIVPLIFSKVILAEDYMPAFALRLTLTRTVLLRIASLGVLMGSLYDKLASRKSLVHHYVENTECDNLQPFLNTTEPDQTCWETYVGQQLYKLLILHFLLVVIMTFIVKFPRKLIYLKLRGKYKLVALFGQQQFDLNKSVLDLVYLQTLCWYMLLLIICACQGLVFSLALSFQPCVVWYALYFSMFKRKYYYLPGYIPLLMSVIAPTATLMYTCEPFQQSGTSKSNSLFMTALLLSFGLSSIPIVFMIGSLSPSKSCGPFRVYSYDNYVMFDAVTNMVNSFPPKARDVLSVLGRGGSMVVMSVLLCFLMYYFWAVGQAHHKMSKLLRDQLKQEGRDKQFLLARVNEVLSTEEFSEVAANG